MFVFFISSLSLSVIRGYMVTLQIASGLEMRSVVRLVADESRGRVGFK